MRRANGWKSDKFKPGNKWMFLTINYWEGLVKRCSTLITACSLSVHYPCLLKGCEITEMQIKGQELWIVLWLVLLNEYEWEFTFFSSRLMNDGIFGCLLKGKGRIMSFELPSWINKWVNLVTFVFTNPPLSNLLDFRVECVEILFRNFPRSLVLYSKVILRTYRHLIPIRFLKMPSFVFSFNM